MVEEESPDINTTRMIQHLDNDYNSSKDPFTNGDVSPKDYLIEQ